MTRLAARRPGTPLVLALGVFVASFAVYAATAARTLWWGDSAEFVAVAHTLGIAHPPGYPLYTLLGALAVRIPLGEPFLRMSLLSALFASGAAGLAVIATWWSGDVLASGAYRTWRRTGGDSPDPRAGFRDPPRIAGSLLAGLALAFAPTFWSQATVPEVYSLSAFLVLAAVLALIAWARGAAAVTAGPEGAGDEGEFRSDRPVIVLALVVGLALAHHLTAALALPSLVAGLIMVRRRPATGSFILAALFLVWGLSLYLYLPLRGHHEPPILWAPVGTWRNALAHITGAQYSSRLFAAPLVAVRHRFAGFVAALPRELPWFVLAASALGAVALWRRAKVVLVLLVPIGLLSLAHAAVYQIPDIESYYIPVYAVLAVVAGIGLTWGLTVVPLRSGAARAAVGWAAAGAVALALVPHVGANWASRDLSSDRSGRLYSDRLLDGLRRDAIVVTMTDRVLFTLWHARYVEGRRPDVAIICAREYAPQLERRLPDVRFPKEDELCSSFEEMPAAFPRPVRGSVPVGNYLPLFVAANEGVRPLYLDPDIGRTLFLDRIAPRGLLVEVTADAADSAAAEADAMNDELWEVVLRELAAGDGAGRPSVEVYAKTLAEQAVILLAKGEVAAAVEGLETAVSLAPDVTFCRNNLGVAYDKAGRYDDAASQFERALELDPGAAAARFNLHLTTLRTGDAARALEELEAAVRLDPRNVRYRIELGSLLESGGDLARAETMFETAAVLSPDDWGARLAHGDFLARRKRYSEAVAAYEYAQELRPGSAGALEGLGRCYWALDDRPQAIEVMTRLVELQPHNPAPKYDLALMLHRSGRAREAVSLLDDVARLLPHMWEARALKAGILGELGRFWEARALFEEATELGASGDAFWGTWTSMERAAGDTVREEAVRVRAEEASGSPDSASGDDPAVSGDTARTGGAAREEEAPRESDREP